jgi:hypothetical protein
MKFNRRDENEQAIVTALQRAGCLVDRVERRPYDLVVGRAGANYLLECKQRLATLTSSQIRFRFLWPGPYAVVRSPEEALKAVGL